MKKAFIYVVYFAAIQAAVTGIGGIILQFNGDKSVMGNTTYLIAATIISSILTIALFLWRKFSIVSPKYMRTQPWMVLIFSVLVSVGTLVPSEWLQEQLPDLPDLVKEQMTMLLKSPYGFFVIGLLAPFCEELVFRGAVLRSLLEWSKQKSGWLNNHWTMIAISAILFALIHFNPAQMPHAFLIGLLLGWLYYRTGSILPGIALHWTNNSIACLLNAVYPDPYAHLDVLLNGEQNVIQALIYSMLILLPSLYMLNKLMKRA
jgi:membrane protease YdiL (CAAX protease family)